jgi:small subunit ribosomal protein S1
LNGIKDDPSHGDDSRLNTIWNRLQRAVHTEEIVEGLIVRCVRRGYLVDFGGVTGFLPGSQLDTLPVADIEPLLSRSLSFKVLRCEPTHGRLIVSRRATLPPIEVENIDLEKKYRVGQRLLGVVAQELPFGTFVDLGGITGFLPADPDNPKTHSGQTISVAVRRIDCEVQRIVLRPDSPEAHPAHSSTNCLAGNPKSAEESDERAAPRDSSRDT